MPARAEIEVRMEVWQTQDRSVRRPPLFCEAGRELNSPDFGLAPKVGLLTCRSSRPAAFPSSKDSGIPDHRADACRRAPCSQWRDRAGFSPASLFTRP